MIARRVLVRLAILVLVAVVAACATVTQYTLPSPDKPVVFPRDDFAHPDFQTEWWYYTGHVTDAAGRKYGFELVFFQRRTEGDRRFGLPLSWYSNPIYFSHFAITDLQTGRHLDQEAFGPTRGGKAGARTDQYLVWIGDWRAERLDRYHHLTASMKGAAIDFLLDPVKPRVIQGAGGISRKGEGGGSSYYISTTRLAVDGYVTLNGEPRRVTGTAWTDHEILGAGMSDKIRGWDWFSIQLNDQTELMLFHLRQKGGGVDPLSAGTYVRADGTYDCFLLSDFSIETRAQWTSPRTKTTYPAKWRVRVPKYDIELDVEPTVSDQELQPRMTGMTYWEGSIRAMGKAGGRDVMGLGYSELTGYNRPVSGL
jgi:predicted secreted hydrolase